MSPKAVFWPTLGLPIQPKFLYLAGIPLAPGKSFKKLSNSPFPKRLQDEHAYWIRLMEPREN